MSTDRSWMTADFLGTYTRFDKPEWTHTDEAENPTRCDYCNLPVPTDEYWTGDGDGMCGSCHAAYTAAVAERGDVLS